jgi:general secretion pathway protein J
MFDGSELSVMFVRTAVGPNAGPGLDVVRVGETTDRREFVTVRSRARFTPLPPATSLSEQMHFGDPVVLLRAPFRLSFAYAGPDRVWKSTWRGSDKLPAMIRLTIRDAATERVLSVSTVAPLHVQVPSDCARPDGGCDGKSGAQQNAPDDARAGIAAAGQGGSL